MSSRLSSTFAVTKVQLAEATVSQVDTRAGIVAGEEPLEIRIDGKALATVLRTPGHDVDLAHGLLYSRALIRRAADVSTARYCAGAVADGLNTYNLLDLSLVGDSRPAVGAAETTIDTAIADVLDTDLTGAVPAASCAASPSDPVADLEAELAATLGPEFSHAETKAINPALVIALLPRLEAGRSLHRKTGGVHAAAVFEASSGEMLLIREDISAENCLFKAIGALLLADHLPDTDLFLVLSFDPSFAAIRQAALAGFGGVITKGVPSSLAVECARAAGLGLVGRADAEGFSLYSGNLAS